MKNKLLILLTCAITALSLLSPYAYAAKSVEQLKKEMQQREAERKKTEKEINSKKDERDAKVQERNELDLKISDLVSDMEDTEDVIDEKNKEIDQKNAEITEYNGIIEENTDKLKTRMKVMYEYGNASYLELIIESKGLSDFFSRVSVVKDIVKHDKELITSYVNAKNEVEAAKAVIESEKKEQEEAKNILESKKDELESLQNQKQELINSLNSDIKSLEAEEKKMEEDYNSLKSELNKAISAQSAKSSAPVYTGNGKFTWPSAVSTRITSGFGKREKPNAKATSVHRGIDIGVPMGSNVLAAEAGTVATAGFNGSYGYYITINHGGGYVTLYAHNSKLLVSKGDIVKRGQVIAKAGSTGNSTGPHIHFEVMVNGVCQNPTKYF